MTPLRFGTSGWRAVLGEEFTVANVRLVCRAIAEHVLETAEAGSPEVVVGYDTRFLSERFARVAADTLADGGLRPLLCDAATPTPAVAFHVLRLGLAGAVTITASHNPPEYNGVKFTPAWGGPALPETTRAIEVRIDAVARRGTEAGPHDPAARPDRLAPRLFDARPDYLAGLSRLVDLDAIRRRRLRVVVDPLYGAARGYLDLALERAGAAVTAIHNVRDPYFGGRRPDPDAEGLRDLSAAVGHNGAALGLATDGDADRFGVVDEEGTFVAPNTVLGVLLDYLATTREWRGGVARSVATTHLIDAVAAEHGLTVHETPVGFKYIGARLADGSAIFGGEESAGLSITGHVPDKDGVLACLLAAEMMARTGEGIRQRTEALFRRVGAYHSTRVDLTTTMSMERRVAAILADPPARLAGTVVDRVVRLDGCKLVLADGSWLLLRPSGTEPLVRCYAEADSPERLAEVLAAGRNLLGA
ncbi:MAG TPA: phosphoglucomutase/phosphomannomutase family protein [Gemmatimonadaceae bacterium]|nr:phosphoglucomutase/phosphomannomutase family protein [Gemmatimonadaceae bacterium]